MNDTKSLDMTRCEILHMIHSCEDICSFNYWNAGGISFSVIIVNVEVVLSMIKNNAFYIECLQTL